MTSSTSGSGPSAAPTVQHELLVPSRLPDAPAESSLPSSPPATDEHWLALASEHLRTEEQTRVAHVFARNDGNLLNLEWVAADAGVTRKTARRIWAILREAELLGRSWRKTLPGQGFVGHVYLLRPVHLRITHRDDQAVSEEYPPASQDVPAGMDSGFAVDYPPGHVLPSMSSGELMSAKDVETSFAREQEHVQQHVDPAHERAMAHIAGLERKYGPIRRGRGRQLLIASIRDHHDAVGRCWNEVARHGENPIGLLIRMLQDGDHLEKEAQ